MGFTRRGKVCEFNATSVCCFRCHLVVMHVMRRSVFHCRTEARESFSPVSAEDYDRQRISITNHQGGCSERRKSVLRKASFPSSRLPSQP